MNRLWPWWAQDWIDVAFYWFTIALLLVIGGGAWVFVVAALLMEGS